MRVIMALFVAFWIFTGVCWVGNIVKLAQCDWSNQGSWKGEIIHSIGIFGPTSLVTFWFDDK